MPPFVQDNPYTIVSRFFMSFPNCQRERLDSAVWDRDVESLPEWKRVVREEARRQAIACLWGLVPNCRTKCQLMKRAHELCDSFNPYPLANERMEFDDEFRLEVEARIDAMIGMKGVK